MSHENLSPSLSLSVGGVAYSTNEMNTVDGTVLDAGVSLSMMRLGGNHTFQLDNHELFINAQLHVSLHSFVIEYS